MTVASGIEVYSELQEQTPEALVRSYAPLVKRIAHHMVARMPSSVQPDDLIQSGMIGLLEASSKYDPGKGASFETYAGIRIRGAMLDEIRKGDWVPLKSKRRPPKSLKLLENKLGRDASDREVAEAMDMTLSEYFDILKDAQGSKLFSFEEIPGSGEPGIQSDSPNPMDQIQKRDFQRCLAEAISTLPEREQLVLSLYYDDELNLREVGEVLGVSESRVSQIHSQAALRLRSKLEEWIN